jgi:hypothetical protein
MLCAIMKAASTTLLHAVQSCLTTPGAVWFALCRCSWLPASTIICCGTWLYLQGTPGGDFGGENERVKHMRCMIIINLFTFSKGAAVKHVIGTVKAAVCSFFVPPGCVVITRASVCKADAANCVHDAPCKLASLSVTHLVNSQA